MAQKTKKVRRTHRLTKHTTQAATKASKALKVRKSSAIGVRAKAARRTAEGKFTKVIFTQIGGKESSRRQSFARFAETDGEFRSEVAELRFQPGTNFAMLHRGRLHMTFAILQGDSVRVTWVTAN